MQKSRMQAAQPAFAAIYCKGMGEYKLDWFKQRSHEGRYRFSYAYSSEPSQEVYICWRPAPWGLTKWKNQFFIPFLIIFALLFEAQCRSWNRGKIGLKLLYQNSQTCAMCCECLYYTYTRTSYASSKVVIHCCTLLSIKQVNLCTVQCTQYILLHFVFCYSLFVITESSVILLHIQEVSRFLT
jgi:hypothetical protein